MARGYVFGTLAACDAARAQVDLAEGYPRAGVNVGSGRHHTPTFVTLTHSLARKHPTLNQWAIVQDARVFEAIDGRGGIPVAIDLDSAWGVDAKAPIEAER